MLNPFRGTDPRVMKAAADPVGPGIDAAIVEVASAAGRVVAGWGTHGVFRGRDAAVCELLAGVELVRIGPPSQGGHPRHPLYLRADLPLVAHP